jgi:hexosaminidase
MQRELWPIGWRRIARALVRAVLSVGFCLLLESEAHPGLASSLYARGYAVIPEPQEMRLDPNDFPISGEWRVERGPAVEAQSAAENVLRTGLEERHAFKLADSGRGPAIRLEIKGGSVPVGNAQDKDREALAREAYKLTLARDGITLTANAPAGLFYGAETLVQLRPG